MRGGEGGVLLVIAPASLGNHEPAPSQRDNDDRAELQGSPLPEGLFNFSRKASTFLEIL